MTIALGSSARSYQRRPCAADVGNAWWLLCHASPKDSGASQSEVARLVAGVEAPPAEEVTQRVDRVRHVVQQHDPHRAAPQQAGQGGLDRPAEREAEAERQREAERRSTTASCGR